MLHGEVDEYIPRSHVDFFLSAIKPQPKFIAFPEGRFAGVLSSTVCQIAEC